MKNLFKEISFPDSLRLNPYYIDVRSPGEFKQDHVPGAVNMPVFDDEERGEIGKIFALLGQEDAIVRGAEIASGKLGGIVANISKVKDRDIVIYCFRGGMRSGSLVSFLSALKFNVFQMINGYKGYRKYVVDNISNYKIKSGIFILQGLTGTGKTEILRRMKSSVDLELLAGHRSSIFGGIGIKQNSQRMFESLLLKRLNELENSEYIIFEGESRKIGNSHIPDNIARYMRNSPIILIEAAVERRVEIIMKEYNLELFIDELIPVVKTLNRKIGNKNVETLLDLLKKMHIDEFVKLLLEKYYDPLYRHSLSGMNFIAEIENINCVNATEQVEDTISEYRRVNPMVTL